VSDINVGKIFRNLDRINYAAVRFSRYGSHTFISDLELSLAGGPYVQIYNEMQSIHERLELGVLRLEIRSHPSRPEAPSVLEKMELFRNGKLLSVEALAAPGFESTSAIRLSLDCGQLVVAAAAFPCSIFVKFGGIEMQEPEYDLDKYRTLELVKTF
jgi:hypothetical protein